ncbi:MAG: SAM-dependent methyltransferase [Anaerolineae bacterium]
MRNYDRMVERYETGAVPWDVAEPPPEVMALADELKPGRALDLGCGYGRTAIYLAQKGWQVDSVDFVPQAVAEAGARAKRAGVADRIKFHQASVAELDFLAGAYQLAVDVGCMHALDEAELRRYAAGLRRLLAAGGQYLLFARLHAELAEPDSGPRGVPDVLIQALFVDGFVLTKMESGETKVEDQPVWTSAWYWFRRTPD